MEHSYYKDKLSAYFDNSLEVQEMELLRRHLESCAECRELLEKLSSLSKKIKELSGLDENEYFDSLAAKIDGKIAGSGKKVVELPHKKSRRFGSGWKIGAVAASFMLIATVTYYQWQGHESILDEIIEQSAKPAMSVEVLKDSVVESKSQPEQAATAAEKADDKAVTTQIKENAKDRPAGVGESKVKAAPKKIVDAKELQGILKFETSGQSIVKPAPVLKQAQEKESESLGEIAEGIFADTINEESDSAEEFRLINLPVTRLAAQTEREEVLAPSIQYWRDKRDSILQAETEVYKTVSREMFKSALVADSVKSGYNSKDSVLALAWYKIGLLTPDSAEKKEAIEFIERQSMRNRADSALIREYLEKLKN